MDGINRTCIGECDTPPKSPRWQRRSQLSGPTYTFGLLYLLRPVSRSGVMLQLPGLRYYPLASLL